MTDDMTVTATKGQYADINGLRLYYNLGVSPLFAEVTLAFLAE